MQEKKAARKRAANAEMAQEILDLIARVTKAVRSPVVMRKALTTVLAVHKARIFQSGQDSGNSKIGKYSTKPISISRNNQARNTGKTYFSGGYAEYHQAIGKGSDVNFRDKDQMMMDYGIVQNGNDFGFGFQNELNFNKSQWVQEHFNKDVMDLSNKELDLLGDVHQAEVEKLI